MDDNGGSHSGTPMAHTHSSRLKNITNYTGKPADTLIIITSVVVGTITAFAWRDLADEIFEKYYNDEAHVVRKRLYYAIFTTIAAVIIILFLSKVGKRKRKKQAIHKH